VNQPEGLISLQEAARRLGVNCGTLRKAVKKGELRAFRVRTIIRIDPLDLRRYLRAHLVAGEMHPHNEDDEAPSCGDPARSSTE
jgi:excisionase family DNA binding protein